MMKPTILAAIDDSTAASPVLAVAATVASLLDGTVQAIHVAEGAKRTAEEVARQHGVPVRIVDGDPTHEVTCAAGDPTVLLVVVGTRGQPAGPRPAGHIALALAARVAKPVLVVPPDVVALDPTHAIRRALFPLEGTPASSVAVTETLHRLARAGVELVATHVFNTTKVPSFWDQSRHAEESWASEFLSRWCAAPEVELHLRRGSPPQTIVDAARAVEADIIVLSWSQDMAPGRASVVRAVLTHASVPVLLLPAV